RCAEPPQGFGARVLTPNQGAPLMPSCEQEFGEVAADAAHSAGCSGHEDRVVVFMFRRHVADLGLRAKDELATRRARWNEWQEADPGRLRSPGLLSIQPRRGDASGAAARRFADRWRLEKRCSRSAH